MRQVLKKYYLILPTFVLLAVTPFTFAAAEEGISLKNKCIKDYPLVNGETDHNLLSLYAQICDSKNKKNDELKNKLLVGEFKHEVRQFQKPYDNQQAEQISLMV